jgi:branched-chain amino acid transport system substrate-binding protein
MIDNFRRNGGPRAIVLGAVILVAAIAPRPAVAEPLTIALIGDGSAAAARCDEGFRLGLEDATEESRGAGGREIAVVSADGAESLARIYRDGKAALAVSTGESASASALAAVAARMKRVLLVAHAPAETSFSRYVFRTAPRAAQAARASVIELGRQELNLLALAPDTADGHDAAAAFKTALEEIPRGVYYAGAIFLDARDVAARLKTHIDGLHDLHGARTLLVIWPGGDAPMAAIAAAAAGPLGIRLAYQGALAPGALPRAPGAEVDAITSYYATLPNTAVNERLAAAWRERHGEPPDQAAAEGFTAARAAVAAVARVSSTETDALVAAFEDLDFESPKGPMHIDKSNHLALQPMYHVLLPAAESAEGPTLVRAITASEVSPQRH